MKTLKLIKNNKLPFFVLGIYFVLFLFSRDKAISAFGNSLYYLWEMIQVMPIVFVLTAIIEAWVPKDIIINRFGEKSGFSGNILALILGSISAGPIYAAFPISNMLLSKGASIANVVIILSSWAVVKIPMLANEAKFLGPSFMVIRWILTVISIFIMGYITSKIVKNKDLVSSKKNLQKESLRINEAYCIGCSICSNLAPDYFNIENKKAILIKEYNPDLNIKEVILASEKCPTNSIDIFK
ncbi:uncharacterized membrane protein YraQ (UPF0718 family) [Acetoanaerobium pronyense]|uniref:Uncharacterized membrane protein YraQ (UPF0718 family) n=1 Tax=Acetoanaerobium pronyense TaxID=1482736 RepID=A0ABS4KMB4_9FIRM|nr:permease [Acetoanaerobium pronyense]MBP2028913.1 uncharacterized membrane protein YraQ (UPF0718 family) [Acetoanaerobium pronyense]